MKTIPPSLPSSVDSQSVEQTQKLAAELAKAYPHGAIICLSGELGSGKTTFVKGFARALGIEQHDVKSPTYTLMREHQVKNTTLYHFDFYRVESIDDVTQHTFEEVISQNKNAWILIEWPERIHQLLTFPHLNVSFTRTGEQSRRIRLSEYAPG